MANEDLKTHLTARGITFASNAGREKLQALLDKADADDAELAAKAAGATGTAANPDADLGKSDTGASAAGAVPAAPAPTAPAPSIVAPAEKAPIPPKEKAPAPPKNDPPVPPVPQTVTVRVIAQAVGEDHGRYEKGQTFQTTSERAAALGALVEVIPDEADAIAE